MTRRQYVGKQKTRKRNIHSLSSQHIRLLKGYWKSICSLISETSLPSPLHSPTKLPSVVSTPLRLENPSIPTLVPRYGIAQSQHQSQTDMAKIYNNAFSYARTSVSLRLRNCPMYFHIPNKIRQEIESKTTSQLSFETTLLRGRKVEIYIASSGSSKPDYEIYIKNMIAWLNYISEFASPKCAQTLKIYLLLTDAKKTIPEMDEDIIDRIHANTAFTTSCSKENTICIFRREEWFKVFIHETFHCFGLDFSALNADESNRHILSHFPTVDPKTDIRLYETFCEMWAEIFHLMFCLFVSKDGRCSQFSETRFQTALQKEQVFSIYQSNKVLRHAVAELRYEELFASDHDKKYREKTQAFSYYVLKSALLWNIDAFIRWCVKYAGPENHPLQFNPQRVAEYCDLVVGLSKQKSYMKIVERTPAKKIKDIPDLENTLRMTAIDPKWYVDSYSTTLARTSLTP